MAKLPALPIFTDAYLADTRHFSTLQHGAYFLLLMIAWRRDECNLPDDDVLLARWAGLDRRTWGNNKVVIMEPWRLKNGFWTQGRLLDERDFSRRKANINSDAGKASALKRKNRDSAAVQRNVNGNSTPTPTGSSNSMNTITPTRENAQSALPIEGGEEKKNTGAAKTKSEKLEDLRMQLTKFEDYCKLHIIPVNVALEMEKFCQYCLSGKGNYSNYEAAFRNWLLRRKEDHPHGSPGKPNPPQPRPDKSDLNKAALLQSAREQGLIA